MIDLILNYNKNIQKHTTILYPQENPKTNHSRDLVNTT